MTVQHADRPTTATTAQALEELRQEISAHLVDARTVTALIWTQPWAGTGYFTPTARRQTDEAIRRERAARIQGDGHLAGLNSSPEVNDAGLNTGAVQAPGNLKALAAEAALTHALREGVRRAIAHLDSRGICWLPRLDHDASLLQVSLHLAELLPHITSREVLETISAELADAVAQGGEIAHGESKTSLEGVPCIHCGRRTLVMLWARPHNDVDVDTVICDRDPRTGHYQVCRCADPLCDCKRRPVSFRHSWQYVSGTGPLTIDFLKRRLAQLRDLKKGNTP